MIGGVRQLYDRQDFDFARPWGRNGFIEDYTAEVRGRPLGCLHAITLNADGQAQHIADHYRPLSSGMFFSHACCAKGSPEPRTPSISSLARIERT